LAHGNKVSVRNCEATEGTSTLLSLNDVTDQRSFINNNSSRAKRAAEGMVPAASQTALEHKNGDAVESPAGGSTTFTAKPIPVTPNASPEAGALLKFLYHLSGRYTMAGAHNQPNFISSKTEEAYRVTGKYPVLWGQDFGFSKEGDKDSITVRQAIVDEARKQFYEKGSIVTLMWHEIIPTDDEPTTFKEGVLTKRLTPEMWKELLTPESPLNRRWQAQVDVIAGYLKQLCDAKVQVIWRPYHEMNGGWFWWGQRLGGAPFQDLYKMMFNRFTKMHGLTNLLWTFDVNYGNQGKENYDLYYPGNELVDILAVDIYNNQFRQDYYEQLLRLGGGKPIAIGECGQMPTSEILGKQPRYLWFMVWSGMFNLTSKAAATELYNSPRVLTRDKMRVPAFATSLTGR
jgi:mannan endo-1,4-beta-mannosidase